MLSLVIRSTQESTTSIFMFSQLIIFKGRSPLNWSSTRSNVRAMKISLNRFLTLEYFKNRLQFVRILNAIARFSRK